MFVEGKSHASEKDRASCIVHLGPKDATKVQPVVGRSSANRLRPEFKELEEGQGASEGVDHISSEKYRALWSHGH